MFNEERPIIVIKKKGGHAAHHGGSWKVAYADFVTAMMAFFLVMWILGLSQDKRKAIASYFQDPVGAMRSTGGSMSPLNTGPQPPGKMQILPSLAALRRETAERNQFKEVKENIEETVAKTPELKQIEEFIQIEIVRDGLRIELIDGQEGLFFDLGSAKIKPRTTAVIRKIGGIIATLPNTVVVEGHTDARPLSTTNSGYSNWELSTDRAQAARRVMVGVLRQDQIERVTGYADSKLRKPSDPLHFSNRRISLLVEYKSIEARMSDTERAQAQLLAEQPKAPVHSMEAEVNQPHHDAGH